MTCRASVYSRGEQSLSTEVVTWEPGNPPSGVFRELRSLEDLNLGEESILDADGGVFL